MKNVFAAEGFLWRLLNRITDIFALSVMFLLSCLPVVTAGAALTALYDSVVRSVRYGEQGPYQRYISVFRRELKSGILSTLVWGTVIAMFVFARSMLASAEMDRSAALVLGAVYYVALLIPIGALCWSCAILSQFTFSFRDLALTAFRFTFAKLPVTVILVLLTLETLQLCVNYIFPAFFAPALMVLLWPLFVERVFTKLGGGLKKADGKETEEGTEEEAEEETGPAASGN